MELTNEQVAELEKWVKEIMEIHTKETTKQVELMDALVTLILQLPSDDDRKRFGAVTTKVLQTMREMHGGFLRVPSFVRRPQDVAE